MGFLAGQEVVRAVVGEGEGVGQPVVVAEADVGGPLAATERIDGQVVGNAANPRGKLALLVVAPAFHGVNGFDEGVLQQVLGHVLCVSDGDQLVIVGVRVGADEGGCWPCPTLML